MGGWAQACSPIMKTTVTLERLKRRGYIEFYDYFQRFIVNISQKLGGVRSALAGLQSRQPSTQLPAGLFSFLSFSFQFSAVLILFFQIGKKRW
jgi:hypothetical protein